MPLDTGGYTDFTLDVPAYSAVQPRALDIAIDPATNNGANLLSIYTGIVRVSAQGVTASKWRLGNMRFHLPTAAGNGT